MNDHNQQNRPSWAPSDPSQNVTESPHEAAQNQTTRASKTIFHSILNKLYQFISSVGHIGLFCENSARKWLLKPNRSLGNRIATYSLGAFIVLFIAGFIVYMGMGWRALPVNFLKGQIETALINSIGGGKVSIDQALLQRDTERGGFYVRLKNLVLYESNGAVVAASPETAIGLKFFPLLAGVVAADSLSLIGPEVHLMRNDEGEWRFLENKSGLPPQKSDLAGGATELTETLSAKGLARIGDVVREGLSGVHQQMQQTSNLSYIGVRRARIVLHETAFDQGEAWLMPSFTVEYDQEKQKHIIGSGILTPENEPYSRVSLALSHRQGDNFIDVKSRLENIVPVQLAAFIPAFSSLSSVKLGVSGAFTGRVDLQEGLHSGELKINLTEGHIELLGPQGPKLQISRGAFDFAMEAGAKHVVLRQGELIYPSGRLSLKGDLWRENSNGGPQDWRFQLYSTDGELFSQDQQLNGKKIDEFGFAGRLFASRHPVLIDEIRIQIGQSSLLMAHDGSLGYPAILRGRFKDIPLDLLKTLWPEGFNEESRTWVFKHMIEGVITGGDFALHDFGGKPKLLKFARAGRGGRLDKTLLLPQMRFEVANPVYTILKEPLMVRGPSARIVIKGHQMDAYMKTGSIHFAQQRSFALIDGHLSIPNFEPAGPESIVKFKVKSEAETAVAFLKRDPFFMDGPKDLGFKKFKGEVEGNLVLRVPMRDEVLDDEVDLSGRLYLKNAEADFRKYSLKNGGIEFNIARNVVEGKGTMLVNGVSANLSFRKSLKKAKSQDLSPLLIQAQIDEADRNQLGLSVNEIVQGPVAVEMTFKPLDNKEFDVHLTADLTKASLVSHALGWRKEIGRPSQLDLEIDDQGKDGVLLKDIKIDGQDLTAVGSLRLDQVTGHVTSFSFPKISYKVVSNIALSGKQVVLPNKRSRLWKITARGKTYDARTVLKSLLQTGQVGKFATSQKSSWDGVDLTANFDTVIGWRDSKLSDFTLTMKRRGDQLKGFQLAGVLRNKGKLKGRLVQDNRNDPQIELRTNNAGEALRFVGFYPNMLGGDGKLSVQYNVKKRQLASKTGNLQIRRFSIASDPVVKKVLANASTKKQGQPVGAEEVISFSRLYAPFSIGQNQFILHESYVKGDLLGATMRGQMDFGRNRVRLSGTYIPLYGLNAAVGAVPVLGDILVGRRGEGMLGITFGIYGNISQPEVLVNPMSLVAPGVFRQIFEFEQNAPKIEARPPAGQKTGSKLDTSASKVRRLKDGETVKKSRTPETSSSLQRK